MLHITYARAAEESSDREYPGWYAAQVDCVSESDDMQRKMSGAYVSLKLGYVAVRNRTPQELAQGVDYQMARQREAHVFSTHTQLRQLDRDRVGVDALLRRITEMQVCASMKFDIELL